LIDWDMTGQRNDKGGEGQVDRGMRSGGMALIIRICLALCYSEKEGAEDSIT